MASAPRFAALQLTCIEQPILMLVNSMRVIYRAAATNSAISPPTCQSAMNPAVKKRKRGGQPKPASERKRNNLTIRVLDELRKRLEAAAEKSQRSVSEEAANRMTLSFMLDSELKDLKEIRKATDDQLEAIMRERGWGTLIDERYGGRIFTRPGQLALPRSEFTSPDQAEMSAPTLSTDEALHQAVEKAVTAALPSALEHAVEKAVAAALSRATLRIGEDK
jgi:hypothetical protein